MKSERDGELTLHERFIKESKRHETTSGQSPEDNTNAWEWYDKVSFLNNIVVGHVKCANVELSVAGLMPIVKISLFCHMMIFIQQTKSSTEVLIVVDGCGAVIENTDLDVKFNEFRLTTSDNNKDAGFYMNEIQSVIAREDMNLLPSVGNNDGGTELHEYEATQSDTNSEWEKLEENGNCSRNSSEEELEENLKRNLKEKKSKKEREKRIKNKELRIHGKKYFALKRITNEVDKNPAKYVYSERKEERIIILKAKLCPNEKQLCLPHTVFYVLKSMKNQAITAESQARECMLSLLSNPKFTCTKFIKDGAKNLTTRQWTEEPSNKFWKKSGNATVNEIKGLLYKRGEILFKLHHSEEWIPLPQRRTRFNNVESAQLYNQARKIEKAKYESLQALKQSMHKDHHLFYDSLAH
ncbi:hypothetical protein ILUMI_25656 [Ignelater luminosus]|uniref:Uncharacterized protein n=1 Tax=Ignelater luminosus TaxID=2038154 RepID=A0A8K0C715_IGNLU|nr:hypothetical protein ILUMI_25656 [Ignelater luminosus]